MPPPTGQRIWVRISVEVPPQAADAVAAALLTVSPNGVTTEDGQCTRVTGYMGPYSSAEAVAEAGQTAQELLDHVPGDLLPRPLKVAAEPEPEEDWMEVFRAQHPPARIGRVIVKPTWAQWPVRGDQKLDDDVIVEIDPGLAFGTGQHPTTRICLEGLQEILCGDERVVDFGCGTGILSIAAAKLGAREVIAIDVDPCAVEIASENVLCNAVEDIVEVRVGGSLESVETGLDLVVANINPVIVAREAQRVAALLRPGGNYLCTGIPTGRAEEVVEALDDAAFAIRSRICGEWIGFTCTAPGGQADAPRLPR